MRSFSVPHTHFQCQVQWLRMHFSYFILIDRQNIFFIGFIFHIQSQTNIITHNIGNNLVFKFYGKKYRYFMLVFFFGAILIWQRSLRFHFCQSFLPRDQKWCAQSQSASFLWLIFQPFLDCCRILEILRVLLEAIVPRFDFVRRLDVRIVVAIFRFNTKESGINNKNDVWRIFKNVIKIVLTYNWLKNDMWIGSTDKGGQHDD